MGSVGPIFTTIGGKIQQQVSGPTTERLLIFGTAVDGPVNQPRQITSQVVADRLFGPASYSNGYKDPNTSTETGKPNGATIPLAIQQAIAAGCTDIWVVRATGSYAKSASAFGCLDITAIYPGRIYNEVSITTTLTGGAVTVTVVQPTMKGGNFVTAFASGATVADVIDTLNGSSNNKTFRINRNTFASTLASAAVSTMTSGTVTLSGGTNGCRTKGDDYGPEAATGVNGYATALAATDSGTFDAVKNANLKFQVAVLTGIYVDDQVVDGGAATTTTIAYDFVKFLDQQSVDVGPCHGVMAVRPPNLGDDASVISWVTNNLLSTSTGAYNSALRWNKAGPFLYNGFLRPDPTGNLVDAGCRLSVVAGPEVILRHPDIGNYVDMYHVLYAALLTTLPPERSATNKALPGVVSYGLNIPKKYCDSLVNGVGYDPTSLDITGKGAYVVLARDRNNFNGALKIYDDPTVAARDDYFRQYQLIHLTNSIHNDLDTHLSPFLGGPTSIQAIAAMETIVTNLLDGYAESGALRGTKGSGYDFWIGMEGNDADVGAIRVKLTINPARALRKIYLEVAVRKS